MDVFVPLGIIYFCISLGLAMYYTMETYRPEFRDGFWLVTFWPILSLWYFCKNFKRGVIYMFYLEKYKIKRL